MKARPLLVKDLIEVLSGLPPESEVWMKWWGGFDRIDLDGPDFTFCPIEIYQRDGVTRLCVDDGEASHIELQEHVTNLVDWIKEKSAK
jgi:hypothetical protein